MLIKFSFDDKDEVVSLITRQSIDTLSKHHHVCSSGADIAQRTASEIRSISPIGVSSRR